MPAAFPENHFDVVSAEFVHKVGNEFGPKSTASSAERMRVVGELKPEPVVEVALSNHLGMKVCVKCNEHDTNGDLKKLVAAQTGTVPTRTGYRNDTTSTKNLRNFLKKIVFDLYFGFLQFWSSGGERKIMPTIGDELERGSLLYNLLTPVISQLCLVWIKTNCS